MDPKDLEELMSSYSRQSTDHLREIAGSSPGSYREEAVEAARAVLSQRDAGVPDPTVAEAARAAERSTETATNRYFDAYLTARTITGVAALIKMLAIAFPITAFVAGVAISGEARDIRLILSGSLLAIFSGVSIYVLGILVSALGHILKANLDTAVHSSPFLSDDQRASIMSIKR